MTPITFVLLAYAWSWAWWIPVVYLYRTTTPTPNLLDMILPVMIGGYGPTVAALVLTARYEGRAGVKRLLRKFLIWRAGGGVWAVVLLAPMLALFVGIGLYARQGHAVGAFDPAGVRLILSGLLMALPFGPLGEELGWRGYLQPRLMERSGPVATSLIIGTVWTFWHTPLYWAPAGTSISGEPVTVLAVLYYLVQVTGLAFLFTWVWMRSSGSVLLAVALHLTFNASLAFAFFPALLPASGAFGASEAMKRINELATPVLWAAVALLLFVERDRWFRRPAGT